MRKYDVLKSWEVIKIFKGEIIFFLNSLKEYFIRNG